MEPSDDAQREVQHRDVGILSLLPTHQQTSEAVEPGVGSLDNPSWRGALTLCVHRSAQGAPSRRPEREAILMGQFAHGPEGVPQVNAKCLTTAPTWQWPSDWNRFKRGARQLEVVRVGASDHEAGGRHASPSTGFSWCPASLCRWDWGRFFPHPAALCLGCQPPPINLRQAVIGQQPLTLELTEDACGKPLPEAPVGR